MSETIILQLPDEAADRYRRSATAARKPLEQFLLERLSESVPPVSEDPSSPLDDELRQMEVLDDESLLAIAGAVLSPDMQRRYDRLLRKNAEGALSMRERESLHALGAEARRLTLKKAHAWLVLKWRGHAHPHPLVGERPSAK